MQEIGVSLSVKQCRNFKINSLDCLKWLAKDCGFRRFRLMSYWDEIEPKPGQYDFKELDKQIAQVAKYKGTVSLCLGARQPRWPENHWPDWVWQLSKDDRTEALLEFLTTVVERYRKAKVIVSYQLENEALLKAFGERAEVDRQRLRQEFLLVKGLDPARPIIMTTSSSWGIPIFGPIPDIVGFSYYQVLYQDGQYARAFHRPWLHKFRAELIKLIWHRPSFIHELQLEPWGPKNIWEMTAREQEKSMSIPQIKQNIASAKATGLKPIDLWGAEWWYWCRQQDDRTIIETVLKELV